MSEFTNRIDDLLFEQNKTRKEMYSNIPNITSQDFYNWSIEHRKPYAIDVVKIAKYLNTTVEFLITGEVSAIETKLKELRQKLITIYKLTEPQKI